MRNATTGDEQRLPVTDEAQPEPNRDEKEGDPSGATPQLDSMRQLGQMNPGPEADSGIHAITIIGQIEGHQVLPAKNKTTKYEHIIPQLIAVEQSSKVKGLLVLLNTVGGDIEAGLAIAEMIRTLSKPTVSLVLGGGHSIGAPIAVAADHSYIADTATVTIHPIRLTGLVIGVPQTYEYLDKMQDRVIGFVTQNSNITAQKFRELMFRSGELMRDIGTVLIGPEAVHVGLCNEVGGVDAAVRKLAELIDEWENGRGFSPHSRELHPMGPVPQAPGWPGPGFAPQAPAPSPMPSPAPSGPSPSPAIVPSAAPFQPQWPGGPPVIPPTPQPATPGAPVPGGVPQPGINPNPPSADPNRFGSGAHPGGDR